MVSSFQKKYIITGAPGTGKTTLISLLKQNVPCMDEVSRKVIIGEQKNGGDGMPWKNINRFADLVYQITIKELIHLHSEALLCDRSLLDIEAYLTVAKKEIPNCFKTFPYHEFYQKKVFFAPTWFEIYCKDEQRLQNFKDCIVLQKTLIECYRKRGFDIVELHKTSPQKRVEFILDLIQ